MYHLHLLNNIIIFLKNEKKCLILENFLSFYVKLEKYSFIKKNLIDYIDKKIIFILQRQADLPLSEISKRVGLSQTPCWNRIRKLEEDGVIEKKSNYH